MDKTPEDRLDHVEEQLRRFTGVMDDMGRDINRPIAAVRDGYYEASLTNAGSIIESMLRDVWQREGIKGEADPAEEEAQVMQQLMFTSLGDALEGTTQQ